MRDEAARQSGPAGDKALAVPDGLSPPIEPTSPRDEGSGPPADHLAWLRDFEARTGRPLRVLHVGNIANNAFLNAKFLRSVGVDAHVLSYDYGHVMATPEWEEVELLNDHGDDFVPRFSRRDLRHYARPDWFVSGPLRVCEWKIRVLCDSDVSPWMRRRLWALQAAVDMAARPFEAAGPKATRAFQLLLTSPLLFVRKTLWYLKSVLSADNLVLDRVSRFTGWLREFRRSFQLDEGTADRLRQLAEGFAEAFPHRKDQLSVREIIPYLSTANLAHAIFRHYDIVQCYATEPIYALLNGKRPYVAFEHGTLRDFTMGDDPLHRLTALAYREADHSFITNGDCLAFARELGVRSYSPIIHPVDVEQHRQDFGEAIAALRREIGGDVVLFCPVRHDWETKGTDVHLRALPLVKSRVSLRIKLVLIRWGTQLADSEALLESLGCADDVVWRRSMCRITMIKHMRAADVVLDQMALPHFGATAPQSIAASRPVISSYVPESTAWMITEPAPILPAFSPEEVADAIVQALDPDWRVDYERRAREWTDRYHHSDNVIHDHLSIYQSILGHDERRDRTEAPL